MIEQKFTIKTGDYAVDFTIPKEAFKYIDHIDLERYFLPAFVALAQLYKEHEE